MLRGREWNPVDPTANFPAMSYVGGYSASEQTRYKRHSMLKHYAKRLILSLFVLFVTMEIGLQVASVVLPAFLVRSEDEHAQAYDLTILCVGDSHTFGTPLPSQDVYPAQLKERLNAGRIDRRARVVNLGIPGQNSVMVANRLEGQINYYQPDLIIV